MEVDVLDQEAFGIRCVRWCIYIHMCVSYVRVYTHVYIYVRAPRLFTTHHVLTAPCSTSIHARTHARLCSIPEFDLSAI